MISYNGFNQGVLTFNGYSASKGAAVSFDSSGCVRTAPSGADIIGVCTGRVNENYVTVQVEGYVEAKYIDTKPQLGYQTLVGNGEGGVKIAAASSDAVGKYKVIKVDTENHIVGFIL